MVFGNILKQKRAHYKLYFMERTSHDIYKYVNYYEFNNFSFNTHWIWLILMCRYWNEEA